MTLHYFKIALRNMRRFKLQAIVCLAIVCACSHQRNDDETVSAAQDNGVKTEILDESVFSDAIALSVEKEFPVDALEASPQMLVWRDSLLIVANGLQLEGEPLVLIYRLGKTPKHVGSFLERGFESGQMMNGKMSIIDDCLFFSDCSNTHRYCEIPLNSIHRFRPSDAVIRNSGVEEHGAAIIPFRNGLLVENPQCYSNADHDIKNDVPRLLYYENGKCRTRQQPTMYQVADINTGAGLHYHPERHRIVYASYNQPVVEFYDDNLQLLRRIEIKSEHKEKIFIHQARMTMNRRTKDSRQSATMNKTRRVVRSGNQLHAFLTSCADSRYIYLVYCGKTFSHSFHTYPTYILQFDWEGRHMRTFSYDRWIWSISPSLQPDMFYLSVFSSDDCSDASCKLVRVGKMQGGNNKD